MLQLSIPCKIGNVDCSGLMRIAPLQWYLKDQPFRYSECRQVKYFESYCNMFLIYYTNTYHIKQKNFAVPVSALYSHLYKSLSPFVVVHESSLPLQRYSFVRLFVANTSDSSQKDDCHVHPNGNNLNELHTVKILCNES